METLTLDARYVAFVAALVVATLEAIKRFDTIGSRPKWWPPLAVATGLLVSVPVLALWPPAATGAALAGFWAVHGVVAGLTACGLYSAAGKAIAGLVGGGK